MPQFLTEPQRNIEIVAEADVVVAGAGPAGVCAAIAAARAGARTLLLERFGFLGGMMTAGLVGPVTRLTATGNAEPIIEGLMREMAEKLHAVGGADSWDNILKNGGMCFDAEMVKIVLDQMVLDAGVEVLLHTFVTDVVTEGDAIQGVLVESKSGRQAVRAKVYIDATGDGDVAFRAGAPTTLGRKADGMPMAMGSMFHLGGVPEMTDELRKTVREALEIGCNNGEFRTYNRGLGGYGSAYRRHVLSLNMTRFPGDCTNVRDLTKGEFSVRRDTHRIIEYLRDKIPALKDMYIANLPPHIGLRESRQVQGDYVLTGEDIVEARKFDDQVALNSWWIDIHCPLGRTDGSIHLCKADCPADPPCLMLKDHPEDLPKKIRLPEGGYNGIPYRCLTPKKVDNLLVAGRCLSATHTAVAGARIMGTCAAMGQAAGIAAAMAAQQGIAPRQVNVPALREAIKKEGGLVD